MKVNIIKTFFILIAVLAVAFPVYALTAGQWEPDGTAIDFKNVIPETITTSGSVIPLVSVINGDEVLDISHEKDAEVIVKKDMSNTPIVFNEYKDYVLSFDFQTDVTDAFREIFHYDGDIGYNNGSRYLIRIAASGDLLYIKDTWGNTIAPISTGVCHNIKLFIDGASRRVYEIRVDDVAYSFDLSHFKYALPEIIDNFNVVQKSWKNTGHSYYDNIVFREIDKTETGVFFKTDTYNEAVAFGDNSTIEVRAAIKSETATEGNMLISVFDGDVLEDVCLISTELAPGMNYPCGELTVDKHTKTVKVFLWDKNFSPLKNVSILEGNSDLLEYKSRVITALSSRTDPVEKEKLSSYLSKMDSDGKFTDITYSTLNTDYCYEHCRRLFNMAQALCLSDYDFGNISKDDVRQGMVKGIKWWASFDTSEFKFDNWYYENITVPGEMGKVLLLMEKCGIAETAICEILKEYMQLKVKEINAVSKIDTGANILQMQRNKSYLALYMEDTNMLLDAFKRINKELRLADSMTELGDLWRKRKWETSVTVSGLPDTYTGIQTDYSYLFHGPQLLSGSYGLTFLLGVSEFLSDTKGLDLFPYDGVKNVIDLLLEHYAYIGRGNTLDYSTIGRTIADKSSLVGVNGYSGVYKACEYLLTLDNSYRRDELLAFANSKPSSDGNIIPAVTGHKYFDKADYTAHVKNDYLFTLKASSARTLASESLSYRNLKGRHLGDGVTFIYRTGKEYNDIFASLNWHRLPGTTAEVKDFEVVSSGTYSYESTKSPNVGGISFNGNGATAMELIRDTLSAKKTWFMFDDAIVCLGAGIACKSDNDIYTSVNQCLSEGDAKYALSDGNVGIIEFGSEENIIKSPKWILHDGIGYIFNSKCNIYAENMQKQGDRYDISWDGSPQKHKTEIVKKDIFSLWFNHKTDNTASYEYIIVPETNEASLDLYVENNTFKINSNTSSIQAVRCENEMQAVFWEGGTANFGDLKISASASCIIAAEVTDGNIELCTAALNPEVQDVTVTVQNGTQVIYINTFSF